MHQLPILTLLAVLSPISPANSADVLIDQADVHLRITDEPVQARCVVIKSSGNYLTDKAHCEDALASRPPNMEGLPDGAFLFPGRDGAYASGSCRLPSFRALPRKYESACAAKLVRMGKAQVAMAMQPEDWIESADLPQSDGMIHLKIGIAADGRASYCVPIKSSGNENFDTAACAAILKRAHFVPATDPDGNPVASSYARAWQL